MSLFGTKSVKSTLFHTTIIAHFCIWHLQGQHKTPLNYHARRRYWRVSSPIGKLEFSNKETGVLQ